MKLISFVAFSAAALCGLNAHGQADRSGLTVETAGSGTTVDLDRVTEPTWVLDPVQRVSVDSSDAGTRPDFFVTIHKIRLAGIGRTGLVFSCQLKDDTDAGTRFNVAIDLDKTIDHGRERMRLQHIAGQLKIGDSSKAERWIWNPETMRVVPHSRKVPRRLFNAVVGGKQVKLKLQGKWKFDQTMPAINGDFRAFVRACPILRPKKS